MSNSHAFYRVGGGHTGISRVGFNEAESGDAPQQLAGRPAFLRTGGGTHNASVILIAGRRRRAEGIRTDAERDRRKHNGVNEDRSPITNETSIAVSGNGSAPSTGRSRWRSPAPMQRRFFVVTLVSMRAPSPMFVAWKAWT